MWASVKGVVKNSITQNKTIGPIRLQTLIGSQIEATAKQVQVTRSKNKFGCLLLLQRPVSINSSLGINPYYLSFLNLSNCTSAVASKLMLNGMIERAM